jgi:hypothetical protein
MNHVKFIGIIQISISLLEMKNNRLFSVFVFFMGTVCRPVSAQSDIKTTARHIISLEFGPSYTGSGDMLGGLLNLEYGLGLSNKFGFGIGCHLGTFPGGAFNNYYKEEHKIRGLDLNGYIFPFGKSKVPYGLFFSSGINFRRWNSFYQTGTINGFTLAGVPIEPNSIVTEVNKYLGYNLMLGYRFNIKSAIDGQVRFGIQNDWPGNIVSSLRLGVGYHF